MKSLGRLLVYCCILCQLIGGLQAQLFLFRNGALYCKWMNRKLCDKKFPFCAKDTTNGVETCKHYKSECAFLIDQCLGRTEFARTAAGTNFNPGCRDINLGTTAVCGI